MALAYVFGVMAASISGQAAPLLHADRPLEFHLAQEDANGSGLVPVHVKGEARIVYISPQVALDDRDIRAAEVVRDATGRPAVQIQLRASGVKKFNALVKAHYHELLAIVVANEVVSAPLIEGGLVDDRLDVTGTFTPNDAERLAKALSKTAPKH
jgi:preprotein translocase subunit SecD